jgi:hypothetical protein
MARSPAEIQTDLALTRHLIERRLEQIERKIPRRWRGPSVLLAGGVVLGLVLSRLPFLALLGTGARAVQTGLTVAGTVGAVDRFLAERHGHRLAA